ncbi:TIM-barrel enzyme family protein [Teratosphaeria nubilosa]|uniref:TIM-barrel enzyme family protein n=1 Tax=Teratosphaeria nubilosa TaxID=161662 RepID=A0A6G1KW93_9PEZI|nr:TIM-barrel enzyme family protein [Teratosphaeria nubilosa]
MAPPTDRKQILQSFRQQIKDGKAIVGAGAGIGLSAKFVEQGGGDLIIIYNSGRFRMAGRGSLAKKSSLDISKFLKQLKDLGFAGVQNFPTVGLIDGTFRANLEETGMSYQMEVDMVKTAHDLDMLTTPYVFNADEATKMAQAGADIVVAHMGLTTSGSIGAQSGKSLDDCVKEIQKIRDAATKVNSDIVVLCHGGPIAKPEDAKFVLERCTGVHGFFGASSMERLPVEEAITGITKTFKGIAVS